MPWPSRSRKPAAWGQARSWSFASPAAATKTRTKSRGSAVSRFDMNANRIDTLFSRLRSEKRCALMPFVTAGDPDLATTALLIAEIVKSGAHLVEIGIPYSDPIADGPVIAASYHRALEGGVKVGHIFQTLRTLRAEGTARFNETPR